MAAATDAELTEATADGLRWVGVARVLTEVLLMATMVVLARLIPPAAFGMFAVAVIVQELAINVPSEGMASALVQRGEIGRAHVEGALAVTLAAGTLLAAATLAAALLVVEPVFGAGTATLVALTSPWFLLGAVLAVPMALLRRRLDFRRLSVLGLVQSVVRSVTAIVLAAALGLDGPALVLGGLAGLTAGVVLGLAFAPVPLPRWRRAAIGDLLAYGGPAALATFAWAGFRNGDYAIVGARLGAAQAGFYWRGFQLAVEYQTKVGEVMAQVAFPVLARAPDARAMFALRRRMVRLLSVVTFPALTFVVVLAPAVVPWLFGPAWRPAVVPTQILAGAGAATVVINAVGTMLMASGRSRAMLGYGVAHFAVYVAAVLAASGSGLAAISATAVGVHAIFVVVAYRLLLRGRAESALRCLWDDVSAAGLSCLMLAAVAWPVARLLAAAPVPVDAACVLAAGTAAYAATLRLCFAAAWADAAAVARRVLPRRPRRRARRGGRFATARP